MYAVEPKGISADGSTLFFNRGNALYEYVGTGNTTPMLVAVNNAGEQMSECPISLGGVESKDNPVSANGQTVFFAPAPCGSPTTVEELYARIDNGQPGAHTVAISEPSKEDCSACQTFESEPSKRSGEEFIGASADG